MHTQFCLAAGKILGVGFKLPSSPLIWICLGEKGKPFQSGRKGLISPLMLSREQ